MTRSKNVGTKHQTTKLITVSRIGGNEIEIIFLLNGTPVDIRTIPSEAMSANLRQIIAQGWAMSPNSPMGIGEALTSAVTADKAAAKAPVVSQAMEASERGSDAINMHLLVAESKASALKFLLTDLRHWADANGVDFDTALKASWDHYYAEL